MSSDPQANTKCYCNVLAMERGLDPAGTAGDFEDAVVIEIPLPWKNNMYQTAGVLPQEMIDLLALWLQRYREGLPYNHAPLMVVPDPAYSRPGFRRVMYYSRPQGPFARYDKLEYLVPEREYGALIWSLFEAKTDLNRFEAYRQPNADSIRDLLVCTHGTVDAACARFGYPLYKYLRQHHASDHLRVWRVSHFGGHIFAPTLIDMPLGHYWGYLDLPHAEQVVAQHGAVETLRDYYRGWAGLEAGFLQAAEREIWQREGWRWFQYPKQGSILAQDSHSEKSQWADICIEFTSFEGTSCAYKARVELHQPIETEHSTNDPTTYLYPQYQVMQLEKCSRTPSESERG